MIKIVIVDDHKLVVRGLTLLLADTDFCRVVASAETGQAAIKTVRQHQPDLVILDFHLPDISGLEVTRKLKQLNPKLKILILSADCNELFSTKLLCTGAIGYLTKKASKDELINAIKLIHRGQKVICPNVVDKILQQKINGTAQSEFHKLSQRELEIAMMVIKGNSIGVIAKKLFISDKTVHTYRYRIYQKLDVTNDVQLTRLALQSEYDLVE